jgi:photosystem II stability/assembly factor-like uncharacterized protein
VRPRSTVFLCVVSLLASISSAQTPRGKTAVPKGVDAALFQALEWRNIGPFRGGRVTAVAGVPDRPWTFFFGSTGGGVWTTEDAGTTWRNVSDGFFKTSSVGAIAVAASDPNVIYVGTGESPIRGNATSHGNGVYRSTDGGKTWASAGLEKTRQISAVRVHPANADHVYVAAQGSPFGPSKDRGIYRSTDGGQSWKQVLFVDETTGASDLSLDPTNPRVLYAAFWDHQRLPWKMRSGGPGSGIHKTTDGGETWKKLTEGLPKGVMGKVKVAVSPALPTRVWANVEAEDGGVYRSDDAGATWQRTSDDRATRARAWYYTHVFAHPKDENTVFVLNAPFLKSVDGGKTFTRVPTPHGDNHALWINPERPEIMINGNDGGANVSLNGGRTWSSQDAQPTAQMYRVFVDRQFPYRVYGGQQDNTTVAIASRGSGPGIARTDWFAVGGCESAHVGANQDDPTLVYAGCYTGIITEYDRRTDQARNIMEYPELRLARPAAGMRDRFNWNAPILVSQHDPRVIYHAGNRLFRSDDRGRTWTAVSPDLTRNEADKQGPGGGPITNEGAGAEVYNTIFYVAESPHEAGTLYAGTDDGLLHVTRDGGRSWANVTPPGIGEAQVNAIEVSPHEPATAWVAATAFRRNDTTPHVLRTTDYGKTWQRLVAGIAEGDFVRVVREDPGRAGLLYAGGETGMYVSFDNGVLWQSLRLNLPVVPVTDLKVAGDDLVASTQGRSFWILDDVTPLRQVGSEVGKAEIFVFKPRRTARVLGAEGPPGEPPRPGLGKNPPNGAILHYYLAKASDQPVRIEILDPSGRVVRSHGTEQKPAPDIPGVEPRPPTPLPAKAGMNRWVWDLRADELTRVPGLFSSQSLSGLRVAPGQYQVRLVRGDKTSIQSFDVVKDPRVAATDDDFREQAELLGRVRERVNEIQGAVLRLRKTRDQVRALVDVTRDREEARALQEMGKGITEKITAWEETLVQPKQKTFQDVINFPNMLVDQYLYLADTVSDADFAPTAAQRERFADLEAEWAKRKGEGDELVEKAVPSFNALVREGGIPAVVVPR